MPRRQLRSGWWPSSGPLGRIAADLEADMAEVEAASVRLRGWTIATCGDSSSMLFELLTGMGA
ncbi:MAG: hypothetical protein CM1200mP26_02580 [Acidimicrobiales bacterium]|nr:MAG: hypothetical protein CM1200mP26_02580 [Acidimicrobiales bacterium]